MQKQFKCNNDPNPSRLIESLRCLGYDNYVAIADVVDNSIDADAEEIKIRIYTEKGDVKIVIADNGIGMDHDTIDQALRLGSITAKNPVSDLGKFGMGLVTAGLSLARKTTVITKKEEEYLTAIADVDHVIKSNTFDKYLGESTKAEIDLFGEYFNNAPSGTIVILENCDGVKNRNTSVFASTLRRHIGRIHRYFLGAGRRIEINGDNVHIIDPLELDDQATEIYSDELYPVTIRNGNGEHIENVRVRIALIPDKPAAGEREIALSLHHQGFYILRNLREIQPAQTLDAFTKHNDFNRMRGEIFLTGDLDNLVGIDFTKRDIVLEQSFRDQLLKHLKPQCTTIKRRESFKTKAKESDEVDGLHKSAQKAIDQKAKLLLTPKSEIEKRGPRVKSTDSKPEPRNKTKRSEFRERQPAAARGCRFEYKNLGANGQIYECELEGRTIVIQWNIQHPFYQRFVLDQRSDGRLVTAVDFLVYSMASAELMMTNDDNLDTLVNLKSIISSNVRTLLS